MIPASWRAELDAIAEVTSDLPHAERRTLYEYVNLSPRERQVAMLTAKGYGCAQVAAQLCISTSSVRSHLSRIYRLHGLCWDAESGDSRDYMRIELAWRYRQVGLALHRLRRDALAEYNAARGGA